MAASGWRLAGASVVAIPLALVVLVAALSGATPGCADAAAPAPAGGSWVATAYGPPWDDGNGSGITATGLNLTGDPTLLEVAVDPAVVALGSYVYVQPNPFGTTGAFYAGDTGKLIVGRHVDVYDWRGRSDQLAWGTRTVTVTPAPSPGAGNLLGAVPTTTPPAGGSAAACASGTLGLTAAETATIASDGSALAPVAAPAAVKLAIAAGNEIHTSPYPSPDVHYGPLSQLWPAYDCSGATSFVLYMAGVLTATAETSTGLEGYGQPGPGRWITIYANSTHAWIVVAGIAFDTADYGGPPVPAGSGPRWRADATANLQDGSAYVVRHPSGL
jgi:3D (Asp-Asp-Asp) domain-containing protein